MVPPFSLFGRTFYPYSLMALVGILLCGFLACRRSRRIGLDDNDTLVLLLWSALGTFVGMHLLYAITTVGDWPTLLSTPLESFQDLLSRLSYVFGGSVFYGGLLAGLLVGLLYLKHKHWSVATYGDLLAPIIPLFHCFGRVGCFLGGCCYGVESSFGWVYHYSLLESANGVSRFPIQLVEAACNLLLFFLLSWLWKRHRLVGRLLPLYLLIYPVVRFIDEFWRGDTLRGFLGVFSTSQWVSLLVFAGAAVWWIVYAAHRRSSSVSPT